MLDPSYIDVECVSAAVTVENIGLESMAHKLAQGLDVVEKGVSTEAISVASPDIEGGEVILDQGQKVAGKVLFGSNTSAKSIEIITPDPVCSQFSDCHIVGNKLQSFLEDESQHSRWDEFIRLAKASSSHEECSQLLRKMERQDSDEEVEP